MKMRLTPSKTIDGEEKNFVWRCGVKYGQRVPWGVYLDRNNRQYDFS